MLKMESLIRSVSESCVAVVNRVEGTEVESEIYEDFLSVTNTPEKFLFFIEMYVGEKEEEEDIDYFKQFVVLSIITVHLVEEHPELAAGYLGYLFGF